MVYSSFQQWKITKSEALNMIHSSIKQILKDHDCKMSLDNLVNHLHSKKVTIHDTKKYNNLVRYIKCNYGGIRKFLDDYNIYAVSGNNNNIVVHLLNGDLTLYNRITKDEDWVLL